MSTLYSTVSKISGSGLKVVVVPRLSVTPTSFSGPAGTPRLIALLEDLAVLRDFDVQDFGERVHDRGADAVEAAGNFVGAAFFVEFAAGMQLRHDDFDGGDRRSCACRSGCRGRRPRR